MTTLWLDGARGSWAPLSATAAVPTRSVTLVATPVRVVWDMGDEDAKRRNGKFLPYEIGPKVCDGPGAPFSTQRAYDPPCGYKYEVSTDYAPLEGPNPDDRFFHVQARIVYELHWTCTGTCDENAGNLPDPPHLTAPMLLRVREVQTVVVPNPPTPSR